MGQPSGSGRAGAPILTENDYSKLTVTTICWIRREVPGEQKKLYEQGEGKRVMKQPGKKAELSKAGPE